MWVGRQPSRDRTTRTKSSVWQQCSREWGAYMHACVCVCIYRYMNSHVCAGRWKVLLMQENYIFWNSEIDVLDPRGVSGDDVCGLHEWGWSMNSSAVCHTGICVTNLFTFTQQSTRLCALDRNNVPFTFYAVSSTFSPRHDANTFKSICLNADIFSFGHLLNYTLFHNIWAVLWQTSFNNRQK